MIPGNGPRRYVWSKDVFQHHYASLLAQRLVRDTSVSREAEEIACRALAQVCTRDFTLRLQRMLADKERSLDLDHAFAHAEAADALSPSGELPESVSESVPESTSVRAMPCHCPARAL